MQTQTQDSRQHQQEARRIRRKARHARTLVTAARDLACRAGDGGLDACELSTGAVRLLDMIEEQLRSIGKAAAVIEGRKPNTQTAKRTA
jgi:hypothetical protein